MKFKKGDWIVLTKPYSSTAIDKPGKVYVVIQEDCGKGLYGVKGWIGFIDPTSKYERERYLESGRYGGSWCPSYFKRIDISLKDMSYLF